MWFFKRKKKVDTTGAILLTQKEYRTITDLNASDPKVRSILDRKGIPIDSKKVKITVGTETFFMSTVIDQFGTKLLD
jgi:hypothetical protein